jgi:16S rRNA U516 pseudouridylate synthase RsuA-like enzyme
MFSNVGLTVSNLKRIRVNKYILPHDLAPGQFREIKKEDIL